MSNSRIRTLDFLPNIFQTDINSQFLGASLDQLVNPPNNTKIQGFIGRKFGYGVNPTDAYVIEPTKQRTDYQLEPGVVFTKPSESVAQDFITYPGILDALTVEGATTAANNHDLFEADFYSWDSFINLDKNVNFEQYYWLANGPELVTVSQGVILQNNNYVVTDEATTYSIVPINESGINENPTINLVRGGTYTFKVNQTSQFWIQGVPGVTGFDPGHTNVQTRNVLGVSNNGTESGIVTFTVPLSDAQSEYTNLPGNNLVDLVSNIPFSQLNGMPVTGTTNVDGVTDLNGRTVMFYGTGQPYEIGVIADFYDDTDYDVIEYEEGFYTHTNLKFYTITYATDPNSPTEFVIRLEEASTIPNLQKITALYGTQYGSKSFFQNIALAIEEIPYLSAQLNTLYYQDGTTAGKVGTINISDPSTSKTINVETDILGKKTYTSPNGIVFTNGLKISFEGNFTPTTYLSGQYYVEGVGTSIILVPTSTLVCPESFATGTYIPWDSTPYDTTPWEGNANIPTIPDYLTIARASIDRNAWTRSNRWFHSDVITAAATYNNNLSSLPTYLSAANRAKRPIIEFYSGLRLFNSGIIGRDPVDFMDVRTTDAYNYVAGETKYYPDVEAYTAYEVASLTGTSFGATRTTSSVTSNEITVSSTSGFRVNDLIIFNSDFAGAVHGTIYYVQQVVNTTHFYISDTFNGPALTLVDTVASVSLTWVPQSTKISIPTNDGPPDFSIPYIFGTFKVGMYVSDDLNYLPNNTQITDITTTTIDSTPYVVLTVAWTVDGSSCYFGGTTSATIVGSEISLDNYALFDGCTIIFAADTDPDISNKIYKVRFSTTVTSDAPVITLTEIENGLVNNNEQTVIKRGYYNKGKEFYFNNSKWILTQEKLTVNQAPLFDIFDKNGKSISTYNASTFTGSTLFQYGIGSGPNDPILGFPILYSSVDTIGDISFNVTLNSDTYKYIDSNGSPVTQNINNGYVLQYTALDSFTRKLGWETAVSTSIQYQIFDFAVVAPADTNTPIQTSYVCDINTVDDGYSNWPKVQVYINNVFQRPNKNGVILDYSYSSDATSTTIILSTPPQIGDNVQILVLSRQVSATAYYEIPFNLSSNPFNDDITIANLGDIKNQYQSICINAGIDGLIFGANDYRDAGDVLPYGTKIIQNSSSLVLPGAALRKQDLSVFNSLLFNSTEYIKFKTLLLNTVNNTPYDQPRSTAYMLDDALSQIALTKTTDQSFFWSDMLPSKTAYVTNTYVFENNLSTTNFKLTKVYDYTQATYDGILVYLTTGSYTRQLVKGAEYTVSETEAVLTINIELSNNDTVTIKEYNKTYGSYAPNTPTKLGLYPAFVPMVIKDPNYSVPTYFIRGHDGSYMISVIRYCLNMNYEYTII